jgi:hypothetical protein
MFSWREELWGPWFTAAFGTHQPESIIHWSVLHLIVAQPFALAPPCVRTVRAGAFPPTTSAPARLTFSYGLRQCPGQATQLPRQFSLVHVEPLGVAMAPEKAGGKVHDADGAHPPTFGVAPTPLEKHGREAQDRRDERGTNSPSTAVDHQTAAESGTTCGFQFHDRRRR